MTKYIFMTILTLTMFCQCSDNSSKKTSNKDSRIEFKEDAFGIGDLNKDGIPDSVHISHYKGNSDSQYQNDTISIFFGTKEGGYQLFSQNTPLCCLGGKPLFRRNGTLKLLRFRFTDNISYESYTFRYQQNDFYLIGYDKHCKEEGNESVNFSTKAVELNYEYYGSDDDVEEDKNEYEEDEEEDEDEDEYENDDDDDDDEEGNDDEENEENEENEEKKDSPYIYKKTTRIKYSIIIDSLIPMRKLDNDTQLYRIGEPIKVSGKPNIDINIPNFGIKQTAVGDLNRDGINDYVFIATDTVNMDEEYNGKKTALGIYLSLPNGQLRKYATYYNVVEREEPSQTSVNYELEITKENTLKFGYNVFCYTGSWFVPQYTWEYKYHNGYFYLIKEWYSSLHRASQEKEYKFKNYLTGQSEYRKEDENGNEIKEDEGNDGSTGNSSDKRGKEPEKVFDIESLKVLE